MKRFISFCLALLLVLGLFGCSKQNQQPTPLPTQQPAQEPTRQPAPEPTPEPTQEPAPEPTPEPTPVPANEEWDFTVQVERSEQEFKAEDDTVIATEAIERPMLRLVNTGGEVFSGSEPGRGVTAQQLAVCEAFNDAASAIGVWDIDMEEEGRSIYEMRKETGDEMPPVGREITVSEINRIGDLLSVLEGDYAYLGGAHPDYGLFQEYDIAPHAVGVPIFEIPYSSISRFLNSYGDELLALPAETKAIGDFHEAQSLWSWLEAGAPVDYHDARTEGDVWYCRVDDPNVSTLADVKKMLSRYVDESFVEEQFTGDCVLREFDGVLYAASVGRGDDLTIASVDYDAQLSGETGKVIVTIHRQDYDDDSGDWVLTGETDVWEFPFTLQNGHAVFSTMKSIY